jgi:amino acid transporter, AAT family
MPFDAEQNPERGLRQQLSAGQIAMVAVGSSIGTGLLLGSGAAVHIAGPAVILSYVIGAFLAWIVTNALGELASVHPAAGSFGVYAERYLNPWAGFVARYGLWFALVTAVGASLVAASTYSRYWFPGVPGVAWVALYSIVLLFINLGSVGDYGHFEYWFAMVKLVTIVAFVLAGALLLAGGRVAPQYRAGGGFFSHGPGSPLLAVSFALFSFLGIEMLAVTSGEAHAVRDIPRAAKVTFALLLFVYVGATAVLVGVVPVESSGVSQSPFVTVFDIAGIPAASSLINLVVLTAALSSANANLYAGSRMLFSLARGGYAHTVFGRLNESGSPRAALLLSASGIPLALVTERWWPQSAFLYILGASLFGGMLAWCVGLAAHISFRRKISPAQFAALPMRAPGGAMLSAIGFAGILLAIGSTWWVPQTRITIVSGLPYLAILSVAYLLARKKRGGGTIS